MSVVVSLVGATGAVGVQFLKVLEQRKFPMRKLRLYATKRSAGTKIRFRGEELTVEETDPAKAFLGADIAFISATTAASADYCPAAARVGAVAIDDSSAFRLDPKVPLVVPEINANDLQWHHGIVSTPNCTTVPLAMVLHALREASPIRRIVVDTYQAVSGTGSAAVRELTDQTRAALSGGKIEKSVYPHQIAFNLIPQVDTFREDGYTKEEWKMQEETRKILGLPGLPFSATCVRVPVYQAHSMAVHIDFERSVEPKQARILLSEMPGVKLADNPEKSLYPLPLQAADTDDVLVGRIRKDASNPTGLALWLSADNLRKGAALNAVQIAEELVRRNLLGKR